MSPHHEHGFDSDDTSLPPPKIENIKYRARELGNELRLCPYCLHRNTRCMDAVGWRRKDRSWKRHRARQAKWT